MSGVFAAVASLLLTLAAPLNTNSFALIVLLTAPASIRIERLREREIAQLGHADPLFLECEGTNIVLIEPDLHDLLPDSEAVNRALRDYVATKRTAIG